MVAPNPIMIEPETPAWWKRAVLQLQTVFLLAKRPLQLTGYTTANLPGADQWKSCIVYDLTTDEVKVSDGVTWNAL